MLILNQFLSVGLAVYNISAAVKIFSKYGPVHCFMIAWWYFHQTLNVFLTDYSLTLLLYFLDFLQMFYVTKQSHGWVAVTLIEVIIVGESVTTSIQSH